MNNDLIAAFGIFILAVVFSINAKVGGFLIAIVVLGMLLKLNSVR